MTVTWGRADEIPIILTTLKDLLGEALNSLDNGCPDRLQISHGQQAIFDDADMAWVRLVQTLPSTDMFGTVDSRHIPRVPLRWAAVVELGVTRCVAGVQVDESGMFLPDSETITADALTIAADARAMNTVVTFLNPWTPDILIRPWTPVGVSGNASGGVQQIVVPFRVCKPQEASGGAV